MNKKVEIPSDAEVRIVWNVKPYDYTEENKKAIRTLMAKKYGIDERRIEILPKVLATSDSEENSDIKKELSDLCNTENQLMLFKKYLTEYNIEDYNWEIIKSIDSDVNSQINYDKYDKYKKYKLKWIKWDNFLSYGEGNFFNFETLKGMVLMNGVPANQTGKTSFAIDLIHFLLFGRCTPLKATTNAEIFNRHKKCTQVKVEGCINIDGTDYVIRRTLNRPKNYTAKSKVSGTLEYFKVDGDNNYEALKEFDSSNADVALNEESVSQTNKAIKDAIGREEDFDMIICSTSKTLSDLIDSTGNTERGKMMTRWLGLDVIDDKSKIAKEIYAQQMGNALFKTKNIDVLKQENTLNQETINSNKEAITVFDNTINGLNKTISEKEAECDTLQSSKTLINEELLRLDKVTIEAEIERITNAGKKASQDILNKKSESDNKQVEIDNKQIEITNFGTIEVPVNALRDATNAYTEASNKLTTLLTKYSQIKDNKAKLQNGEYCPTCKQKLQNVNNSALIAECDVELDTISRAGALARTEKDKKEAELKAVNELVEKQQQLQRLINEKQSLENQKNVIALAIGALETKRVEFREQYKAQQQLLKDYEANKEAIDKNAEMDRLILNKKNELEGYRRSLHEQEAKKLNLERDNKDLEKAINDNKADIAEIEKEIELEKNWQIYMQMLGKNGVSKMELRTLTPIINIKLKEILSDVVDFDVELEVTDKNEVAFNLVTNNNGEVIKANLASGSGFERTASALALRFVLGSITSIPQPNFFVIDEVLDGVASENYYKIKDLFDKILSNSNGIDFILHCTHIDDVKDWHKSIITINKINRISTVSHTSIMG